MKKVGVLASILGAALIAIGALGASVPFSMPWAGVSRAAMAFAFATSVAFVVVGLRLLRGGLDAAQGRLAGAERLAGSTRSVALLAIAAGAAGLALGARPSAARAGATVAGMVAAVALALFAGRALRRWLAHQPRREDGARE